MVEVVVGFMGNVVERFMVMVPIYSLGKVLFMGRKLVTFLGRVLVGCLMDLVLLEF